MPSKPTPKPEVVLPASKDAMLIRCVMHSNTSAGFKVIDGSAEFHNCVGWRKVVDDSGNEAIEKF